MLLYGCRYCCSILNLCCGPLSVGGFHCVCLARCLSWLAIPPLIIFYYFIFLVVSGVTIMSVLVYLSSYWQGGTAGCLDPCSAQLGVDVLRVPRVCAAV